jgi:hypothetical protein
MPDKKTGKNVSPSGRRTVVAIEQKEAHIACGHCNKKFPMATKTAEIVAHYEEAHPKIEIPKRWR